MQRRHAVDRKPADDAEIRHPHLTVRDHRQLMPHRFVIRPALLHLLFQSLVDLFDDQHMARQQTAHQLLIPALQRLRHQRVVGVSKQPAGDLPRLIPAQLMLIQQHTQHLRDSDGGMRIVELNHFEVRQAMNAASRQMVTTQDIRHRTGALEILLHQAQPLASLMVVIGIEHFGQFCRLDARLLRLQKIAVVKRREIKRMRTHCLPKTQRQRHAVAVAGHR